MQIIGNREIFNEVYDISAKEYKAIQLIDINKAYTIKGRFSEIRKRLSS